MSLFSIVFANLSINIAIFLWGQPIIWKFILILTNDIEIYVDDSTHFKQMKIEIATGPEKISLVPQFIHVTTRSMPNIRNRFIIYT